MHRRLICLSVLLVLLSGFVASSSVGAAPSIFELGEVEPGETIEKNIYVQTNFQNEFVVNPSVNTGPHDGHFSNENSLAHEISEADIDDWIETEENVPVDPNDTQSYELSDGTSVNANAYFNFRLEVPGNAEPGYYFGRIRLNPEIESEENGAGTTNWGETIPTFRFQVPGQAERSIEVTDVNGIRIGEEQVQLIMQLQNTGTVTTRMTGGNLSILDIDGFEIDELSMPPATLAPGEVAEVDRNWDYEDLEGGNYEVDGLGDYRTGETYISGDFSVSSVIRDRQTIDQPEAEQDEEGFDIPFTLVIMILLILGTVLYFFEIDFLWTIVIVGFVGISAFIFFSTASNYLILILLGLILVTVYYGS